MKVMVEAVYVGDVDSPLNFNDTAESMALKWLTNEDDLHLCPDSPNLVQRFFIASMYFRLGGGTWSDCTVQECSGSPFMSAVSECEWDGIICNVNGMIKEIHLNERNVTGSLSEGISLLESLEVIAMDDNELTGTIPESLGSLSKLTVVDLDNNLLTGPIPEFLFNASMIKVIDLDTNQLTGTLSTRFGELTSLYFLQLDKNQFRGSIPVELTNLPDLKYLSLFQNNFTSSIPSALCGQEKQIFADCDVCTIDDCCKACLV